MKKISVKVKTGAKIEKIEKDPLGGYNVRVRERPTDGRANEAVIEALAEYFGVPKSAVSIISGHASKTKIIGIS
ncbi:hypothetical protein A2662_00400 [Candidatus Giovannonibacteria bacterium RIFCSPHIGHO2_01_FULL_45_33]|uniref:Uncharacterized protein n=1 Tax=Candidatus Giovannonibacteria bacterium RIFCSPLOWO2_01_FULL_45_34 TaxID=1798351 RepID=A0A1F5WZ76_9BACT|nr:MAG: hypothetical protein A2662_00400 [Candidatus Giovannonibacteria bacterium RIFCSPHIGHO2_01_FULL_45_33]OGF70650.1 MAG: hypothetical protein A3C73_02100 [Candidatus Giovannonibacteria bacterium RIFCSPHIGHO2_02_FULL_44_11]OGF80611.1 MAG: hypothetical protein A2930_02920 [Candidatus Giovannonibacteria bacterium RIFCSPLOWO2_01_FULL_45_34]